MRSVLKPGRLGITSWALSWLSELFSVKCSGERALRSAEEGRGLRQPRPEPVFFSHFLIFYNRVDSSITINNQTLKTTGWNPVRWHHCHHPRSSEGFVHFRFIKLVFQPIYNPTPELPSRYTQRQNSYRATESVGRWRLQNTTSY